MQLLISCIDDSSLWKHDYSPDVIILHLYATDTFHRATDKVFQCRILARDESGNRIIIIKKLYIYVAPRNFISFDTQLIISSRLSIFYNCPDKWKLRIPLRLVHGLTRIVVFKLFETATETSE